MSTIIDWEVPSDKFIIRVIKMDFFPKEGFFKENNYHVNKLYNLGVSILKSHIRVLDK